MSFFTVCLALIVSLLVFAALFRLFAWALNQGGRKGPLVAGPCIGGFVTAWACAMESLAQIHAVVGWSPVYVLILFGTALAVGGWLNYCTVALARRR